MYAILISAALALYSLILIDFNNLHHEMALNNDVLNSAQALYAAEGAVEKTVSLIGQSQAPVSNIQFLNESNDREHANESEFLTYNQGADSFYTQRKLKINESFLHSSSGSVSMPVDRDKHLVSHQPSERVLSHAAYYGVESQTSKSFVLREIGAEYNFNEIQFDFNQGEEGSELLFEVFALPREGQALDFPDFATLEADPNMGSTRRLTINTADHSSTGMVQNVGLPLVVDVRGQGGPFKKVIHISGFQPLAYNYILQFQTLDNKPIHFKLTASHQGRNVVIPGLMQTFDLIGATPGGLYQRVKYQRQTEEGLAPGLNYAHFSDGSISK